MKKDVITESESVDFWEGNADSWTALSRLGYDICRDGLNLPAFLKILPEVRGLKGLDIGCGEGTNTRAVAGRGASMTAVDPSSRFIEHARSFEDPTKSDSSSYTIDYQVQSATNLSFADDSFDFAMSTMVLMDIPELEKVLKEVYRVVKPGGFFQFSIVHPCFSTPELGWLEEEQEDGSIRRRLMVSKYFDEGAYLEEWTFSALPDDLSARHPEFKVAHYHRTLSTWLNSLVKAGFLLEESHEPRPEPEVIEKFPELARPATVAWFLHLRVRVPSSA